MLATVTPLASDAQQLISMYSSPDNVGEGIMSSDCLSAAFVRLFTSHSSGEILLPQCLMNALNNCGIFVMY